jgi:ribonuclease P protein component
MQTFGKAERVCNGRTIEKLFKTGTTVKAYPLMASWTETEKSDQSSLSVLISVSSKRFRLAVDRNLLKRRIREAYRKNKMPLLQFAEQKNLNIALLLIYSGKEPESYKMIERKIIVILQRLMQTYEENTD